MYNQQRGKKHSTNVCQHAKIETHVVVVVIELLFAKSVMHNCSYFFSKGRDIPSFRFLKKISRPTQVMLG
jgi:hypothetical protein